MTAKETAKKIKVFLKENNYEIIIGVSTIASVFLCHRIYKIGCAEGFKKGFESCNRIVMIADPDGYPILKKKANVIIRNDLFKTN